MNMESHDYFRARLSQAVIELFRDYGVECTSTGGASTGCLAAPSEGEVGSMVGLKGNNFRGGLALVAPAALVAQMLPVPPVVERADLQLRDWSAEMANQLIGRLKNKLATRALDFDVGPATCFRCTSIRFSFPPDANGVSLSFTTPSAQVRVYLDCSFIADLVASDDPTMQVIAEGDTVLF